MQQQIQIDVNDIIEENGMVKCGMYTGGSWVRIWMSVTDYNTLVREGFFIRDGKSRDSAGVLNTTETFHTTIKLKQHA